MDPDTALFPSSPTNSSPSSSDLDTESTGSFFPDRSTTLGTLMGVNFAAATEASAVRPGGVPSRRDANGGGTVAKKAAERRQRGSGERRRSWWRLCRDDMVGSTALGEYLQVERRSSVDSGAVAGNAGVAEGRFFGEEVGVEVEHVAVGGGRLFENGRVLPPPSAAMVTVVERRRRERVPVLLAGICSGGVG